MKPYIQLCFLLFSFYASSQNHFPEYYFSVDSARTFIKQDKLQEAITLFERAFSLVEAPLKGDLALAIKTAKRIDNNDLEDTWSKKLESLQKTIDSDYKAFIDSLYKVDQSVRNGKYSKALFYIVNSQDSSFQTNPEKLKKCQALLKEWKATDSLNSTALLIEIQKRGFPGSQKIGSRSSGFAIAILIHYGLSAPETSLVPVLDSALNRGELSPKAYAYIVDSQRMRYKKEQLYCMYNPHLYHALTRDQKDKVLQNRKAIGLTSNTYLSGFFGKEVEMD